MSNWGNMLLGRPKKLSQVKAKEKVDKEVSGNVKDPVQEQVQQGPEVVGDSVAADIKKFKGFAGNVKETISSSLQPVIKKGARSGSGITSSASGLIDKKFLQRLIKIFLVLLFVMVLLVIGLQLFIPDDNNGPSNGSNPEETPVIPTYQPTFPSVYSDDKEVLKIEEDLNILEREISGTRIDETTLNYPDLDYKITF